MKQDYYTNVGNAHIFHMADAAKLKALAGTVESINEGIAIVAFPLHIPNGVRGMRSEFTLAQFANGPEPIVGMNVIAQKGALRTVNPRRNRRP